MPPCTGCLTFPHGRLSIYACILAVSSYLFTISSTSGCYYVQTETYFSELLRGQPGLREFGMKNNVGIFSYQDPLRKDSSKFTCYYYTSEMLGGMSSGFKAARAFAVLANIVVGVGAIFVLCMACMQMPTIAIQTVGGMFFAGSLFMLFTFSLFGADFCNDPSYCHFYIGAFFAICALVLCAITGIILFIVPAHGDDLGTVIMPGPNTNKVVGNKQPKAFEPGTQTVTETKLPDGRKKITKTTVNADGSQIVEETIQ